MSRIRCKPVCLSMARAFRGANSRWWTRACRARLAYARSSAQRAGVQPTGHGFPLPNEVGEAPLNIVIAGGTTSTDQMIASTERGVLVTRLWYIREVDPYEKIMTGMTRDGTFLIENGGALPGACGISASIRASSNC